MKEPTIIRNICSTEQGWTRHRKKNEESCKECRDAHNVHRRTVQYSTEANRKHQVAYLSKPEKKQRAVEYSRNYVRPMTEEQLAAKEKSRRQTQLRRIHRKLLDLQEKKIREEAKQARIALKIEKEAAHKAQMAINAENRRIAVEAYRAEKKSKDEIAKEARRIERDRLRAEKAALRPAPLTPEEKEGRKQGRIKANLEAKMARVVEHGSSYNMYELCRFQNGAACKPCKAAAAEYARNRPNKIVYNQVHGKRRKEQAKINGRTYYSRISILERDDYTCHICKEKTDPTATHVMGQPGWERYPHLDHVIPISKGGPDIPDNVKVAHAECNLIKGDTPTIAV